MGKRGNATRLEPVSFTNQSGWNVPRSSRSGTGLEERGGCNVPRSSRDDGGGGGGDDDAMEGRKKNCHDLAVPVRVPVPVNILVVSAVAGSRHTLLLSASGAVWAFGAPPSEFNFRIQLPNSTPSEFKPFRIQPLPNSTPSEFHPFRIQPLPNSTSSEFKPFRIQILPNSTLPNSGDGDNGQLGLRTREAQWTPQALTLSAASSSSAHHVCRQLAAGADHSLLLVHDGCSREVTA
jgi:hypothetical protein